MEKPDIIIDLEKRISIKLKFFDSGATEAPINTYQLNEKNEVIGLRFTNIKIKDLTFLKKFSKLTFLGLGSSQIEDLSIIKNMKELTYLDISNNYIEEISFLKNLKKLNNLDINRNRISNISAIKDLNKLKILKLWSNPISDISFLKEMKELEHLDLWSTQVKDFEALNFLPELKRLDLGSMGINDILFIKNLSKLNYLSLSNNRIKDFSILKNLHHLNSLDLSHNKIEDITFLKDLNQLTHLYLNQNHGIKNYSSLVFLQKLEVLQLNDNNLGDISFLKNLNQINSLSIRDNLISDISILKGFDNLYTLDLFNNQIKDIRPLINRIKDGIEIGDNYGFGLNVIANPLEYPTSQTVKRGKDAILRFFDKIEKEGIAPIFESKVTFVGEGSAGKTSLQRRLIDSKAILPKEDKRTRGIEVIDWEFKKANGKIHIAHIWDFGGQDVYYPVHRFFLTENSVFVLLASSRQNSNNFEYWIPTIFQFGGRSPIILAQTCHDGNRTPWNDLGTYLASDNFNIIKDHNSVYHEINLKNSKNIGLSQIKKSIINQILNLPHYKKNVPKSWIGVRELINSLKNNNCISYIELKKKIKDLNPQSFSSKEDIEDCLKFFHDIGIVLWYYKETNLKNWVVLNPSWSVDAVYKIIDDEKILNQKGIILNVDFDRVWKEKKYEDKHSILKDMLAVFKIAFPKKHNTNDFIIPARLVSIPRESIWEDINLDLHIEYKYEFMPKGMVNQISAELSRYIVSDEQVWNNGVNLIYEQSKSQIFEDFYNRKITIKARGKDSRGVIMTIMNAIKNITEEYKGVLPKIIIPCPCEICKKHSEPEKFSYDNLLIKLEKNRDARVMCNNSDTVFQIETLLYKNGLPNINEINSKYDKEFDENKTKNNEKDTREKKLKVFVTYSWTDEKGKFDQEHQDRVGKFVHQLRTRWGMDASFDLHKQETNFVKMMYENLSKNDKVIIVLTEGYSKKANDFKGGVGTEYQGIINDISQNSSKYIFISFEERSYKIYPFGFKGNDTILISEDLVSDNFPENQNQLLSKLTDDPIVDIPEVGKEIPKVKKRKFE